MTDSEKIVFLFGIVAVPMVVLIPASHPHLALIYICAANSQFAMLSGFVCVLCSRYYSKYFPKTFVNVAVMGFTLCMVLTPFYANETIDSPRKSYALLYVKWVIAASFLLRVMHWFYCEYVLLLIVPRCRLYYALCLSRTPGPATTDEKKNEIDWKKRHEDNTAYFPCMYVLVAIMCLIFLGAMNTLNPDYYDLTPIDLYYVNLPLIVFQICIFVLSSQLSKHSIVAYLQALLESKKSYVRYVSPTSLNLVPPTLDPSNRPPFNPHTPLPSPDPNPHHLPISLTPSKQVHLARAAHPPQHCLSRPQHDAR